MYEYDVSKSNMWREVHEQPEIIRHAIDVNLPIIENICKEVDNMKDKRAKKYEYVIAESDWRTYLSSNKYIKNNSNKYIITREILQFSTNDMDLKYKAAKEIRCQNALEDDNFLNEGVSIRKFKQRVI